MTAPQDGKPAVLGGTPRITGNLPITRPTLPGGAEVASDVAEIIAGGQLTNGERVAAFEERAAAYLGVEHAVAVSSCSIGLLLVARCLGLEGEVILPSYTFCATAHALLWNGLVPVFVDCRADTWNIDPARAAAAITPRTSAIFAVHVFGNPCALDELTALARRHGLALVVDAAHAFGSRYAGRPVGGWGAAEVFSLSPTKVLVAGEGGLIGTRDPRLAERLRMARNYGHAGDYDCRLCGVNARMTEMNAALGLRCLAALEENLERRLHRVWEYVARLGGLPGVSVQRVRPGDRSTYKDFTIRVDERAFGLDRDDLAQALAAEGIATKKYYHPAVHDQQAYRAFRPPAGRLPVTCDLARRALSLPLYSHMPPAEVAAVVEAVAAIQRYAGDVAGTLQSARPNRKGVALNVPAAM